MTILVYDKGEVARCSVSFYNASAALADPTVITFTFTSPDGVTTTYTYGTDNQLAKDATGQYHVDLTCSQAGDWYYRFKGTGAVQLVEAGQFSVKPDGFG